MHKKSIVLTIALSLALAGCSTEADVSTSTSAPPSTAAEPATTTATEASSTEAPTTTEPSPTTTTEAPPEMLVVEINYESGAVEGGGRIEVPLGEPVLIRIDSDVADEGHLHGYDIFVDLEPGTTGTIEFVADIPGIFELELEESRVLLADLEVAP